MPIRSAEAAGSADGPESLKPFEIASFSAKERKRTAPVERITKPLLYR
jgi:hypothetical protein